MTLVAMPFNLMNTTSYGIVSCRFKHRENQSADGERQLRRMTKKGAKKSVQTTPSTAATEQELSGVSSQ